MTEPAYRRAFNPQDFLGYFRWSKDLSAGLNELLHHACHENELKLFLENRYLSLHSKWSIDLPEHGVCSIPGVWTCLNHYSPGNNYGPFLIRFPISVLNGRRFMAFLRKGSDRKRFVFVQYEAFIPIYSIKDKTWKRVDPLSYFEKDSDSSFSLKRRAIYDIVLTERVIIQKETDILPVRHPTCISAKCAGMEVGKARKALRKIVEQEFDRLIDKKNIVRELLQRFPYLDEEDVKVQIITGI